MIRAKKGHEMNINFPPVDERYIKSKVGGGFYSNATELVRDAVRRMRERDDSPHARLVAALEAGEQAIREGRTVPYTPDFLDECEKRACRNLAEGKELNPDVLP